MVPLSTLTSYKLIENAPLISHYNLFRSAEIDGGPAPGYSSGDALTALKEVADQTLPQGFGYEFSGLKPRRVVIWFKNCVHIHVVYWLCVPYSWLLCMKAGRCHFRYCLRCHWAHLELYFS
jgi:hypothetical protein